MNLFNLFLFFSEVTINWNFRTDLAKKSWTRKVNRIFPRGALQSIMKDLELDSYFATSPACVFRVSVSQINTGQKFFILLYIINYSSWCVNELLAQCVVCMSNYLLQQKLYRELSKLELVAPRLHSSRYVASFVIPFQFIVDFLSFSCMSMVRIFVIFSLIKVGDIIYYMMPVKSFEFRI